jgi:hypothetical protein
MSEQRNAAARNAAFASLSIGHQRRLNFGNTMLAARFAEVN